MMQFNLQIEHPALVAPCLNLIHAHSICFGDAKPDKAKCIVGETRVPETKFVASSRSQIGQNMALQKFGNRGFGGGIARCHRSSGWFGRRGCNWLWCDRGLR